MKYGQIPGIAKPVSRLVQGVAPVNPDDREACFRLFDLALEHGYNTFDTAENYGESRESVFGDWMRARGVRDQVVIIAKGAHHYDGVNRVTPEDIQADMRKTLTHMGVDFLDLYILHRDDPAYPVGPIVQALTDHVRAGRIGAFGGSNWSWQRVREANEYAQAHGLIPFAVSSPNFSLAGMVEEPWENCVSISGQAGADARRWYAEAGVAVFAWSSLASGFFSGRFRRDNRSAFAPDAYWDQLVLRCYASEENFQRLDRLQALAAEKGVSVAQAALAYVLCQPPEMYGLVFCADARQFTDNAAALDLALTPQETAWLDLRTETR